MSTVRKYIIVYMYFRATSIYEFTWPNIDKFCDYNIFCACMDTVP